MAKDEKGARCQTDHEKELRLDWTRHQEAYNQHHTQRPNLEPEWKKEEGKAQRQLKARHGGGDEETGRISQSLAR